MKVFEEIVLCKCKSPEHQILFRVFDSSCDVYVNIHLVRLPFWKRLKAGIKYIFGYKCRFGDFEEIILKPEDAPKFKKIYKWLNVKRKEHGKTDNS